MAEAAHPWPEYIHQSFNSAIISDPSGRDQSVFYGPFMRLLYSLFSIDGPYEITVAKIKSVAPQGTQESIDIAAALVVQVNRRPVFFMEVNPPTAFLTESKKRAGVAPSSAAVLDGRRRLYSPKKRAGVAPSYSTLDRSKN